MRILQLIQTLQSGGAERMAVDLSNELCKYHDVYLYTLDAHTNEDIYLDLIDKRVVTGSLNRKGWFDIELIRQLRKLIKEVEPDVIHTHHRAFHFVSIIFFFNRNIKIVHTIHNSNSYKAYHPAEHKFFKFFYRFSNILPVVISTEAKKNFLKLYKYPKVELVYNGRSKITPSKNVDYVKQFINDNKINDSTKVYISIGRLSPVKNHYLLINAFNKLINEGSNAILVIIGRGIETDKESLDIIKFVKKAENNNIFWIGERRNATDYLFYADFFCLSSFSEAMPISLLEAMSVGVIPISTPVGEVPYVIKDLNPKYLSENNYSVDSYYEQLKKAYDAVNNNNLRNQIINIFDNEYTIECCANNYIKLYKKLNNDTIN